MSRVKVAVLLGGPSPERTVSIASGEKICRVFDRDRYEVVPIEISPTQEWVVYGEPARVECSPADRAESISRILRRHAIEVVFIALHGAYGEDGTVQGLLEGLGVPYVGSKVLASALCMDKCRCKCILQQRGVLVARGERFDRWAWERGQGAVLATVEAHFQFPVVAKPNSLGSSIGIAIAHDARELEAALEEIFRLDREALVEEYLIGPELTVGVLEKLAPLGEPEALPVVEIRSRHEFFDYTSKYDAQLCDEIVPARLEPALAQVVQGAAVETHQALGCAGFSRADFILAGTRPYLLEVNTIPGMTPVSLYPKAAGAAGIDFPQLLDRLCQLALQGR